MARFSSPAATQRRSAPTRTQLPADLSSLSTMASCVRPVRDFSASMAAVLPRTIASQTSPIRARTDDGRKRAKARGVKFGRPVKLTVHQRQEALQRLAEGAVQADLARSYGVSEATISRLAAASPFAQSVAVGPG